MNYLDLIKASKNKEKIPGIDKMRWTKTEKTRADQGICMKCGQNPSTPHSFLCGNCEASQSLEDIQAEIAQARKQILAGGSGS